MDEIQDPSFSQPQCETCGLPIRSASFEIEKPHYGYLYKTEGGLMRGGAEGLPRPKPFNSNVFRGTSGQWHHDDPRATYDHRPEPGAWGARHTHESDYERQERNWRMEELEKRHYLGDQFKRSDSDGD